VVVKLKVEGIGDSLGVILPQEILERLDVRVGDFLLLTEAPGGFRIARCDSEFEEQMTLARKFMSERRDLLRKLAKS
jgi:putative addiction module antidote